jgi:hypothetical protein
MLVMGLAPSFLVRVGVIDAKSRDCKFQYASQNNTTSTFGNLQPETPHSKHQQTMAHEDPDFDGYNLSDSDDNLFDTPAPAQKATSKGTTGANGKSTEPAQLKPRPEESRYDAEEAEKSRDAQLRQELENVRKINQVIEGVVESLEKAKNNMDVRNPSPSKSTPISNYSQTVSRTVTSASTLLQTWTRILSQTEHNQRLILNPTWQGATQDLAAIEQDEVQRQRDTQRRQIEEQQRREAAARKAEEEERKREAAAASRGTRGARGRVRGSARAGSSTASSSSGYVGVGGQGGRGSRYTTSGTSRTGTAGTSRGSRGRGKGAS